MERLKKIGELLVATRKCTNAHMKYMEMPREYIKGQNLYMREVHFLTNIPNENMLPISKLAKELEVSQGAVSQIAKRLENKKLIVRGSDPEDNRKKVVGLTELGKEVKANHIEYDKNRYKEINDYLNIFSDSEIEVITRYEELMAKLFNEETEKIEKVVIDK